MKNEQEADALLNSYMYNFTESSMRDATIAIFWAINEEDAKDFLFRREVTRKRIVQRYAHTLRRLRQKGLLTESTICELSSRTVPKCCFGVWNCLMNLSEKMNITDEMWYVAIDLLLIIKKPMLLSDLETSLVPFCEDNIEELYVLLDSAVAQHIARCTLEDATKILRKNNDTLTKKEALSWATQVAEERMQEEENRRVAIQKELDASEKERELLTKSMETLKREIRQLEKECYLLRKENGRMSEELARHFFPDTLLFEDEYMPDVTDANADYIEEGDSFLDSAELPELPKTGIMFVGGHPNFLKKLRDLYPDWVYVTHKNAPERMAQYSKLHACFICAEHMDHTLFYSVIAAVRSSNLPHGYVKATNIERVVLEMRQDYAVMLQNKENASQ